MKQILISLSNFLRYLAQEESKVLRNSREQKWEVTLRSGEYETILLDLPVLVRHSNDGKMVGVELWDEVFESRRMLANK